MRLPYTPVRVSAPAEPPVTLEEAKLYCRVDGGDEDLMIAGLVQAVTDHLDGYAGVLHRCLVTQTWSITFDRFACGLRLPLPAASIVTVEYLDDDGEWQAVADTVWTLRHDALGSFVELKRDQAWPSISVEPAAVKITFTSGYGAPAAVPDSIKTAIKMTVAQIYDRRGPGADAEGIVMSVAAQFFLRPHALKRL